MSNTMEHNISHLIEFGLHALSILSFAGYVVVLDVFGSHREDGDPETTLAPVVVPMLVNIYCIIISTSMSSHLTLALRSG